MIDFFDNLGRCSIPDKLFEILKNYQATPPAFDAGTPWEMNPKPAIWTLVETFISKNSTHKVERCGDELRCTCPAFQSTNGHCKHTYLIKEQLGL